MIRLDVEQGSAEWVAARVGIPTASQFHRIITAGMKLSASADAYMCDLLAEWMLGSALDSAVTEWMERGKDLEESAIRFYEFQREAATERVGFLMRDDGKVGCSPDRLVGEDGGLEIKCPKAGIHVAHMLDMPAKFMPQVQGNLWISGRQWWDLLSFHPELPPALVRVQRDEEYIAALAKAVDAFLMRLGAGKALMVERGHGPAEMRVEQFTEGF